jgi:hypothetical protein
VIVLLIPGLASVCVLVLGVGVGMNDPFWPVRPVIRRWKRPPRYVASRPRTSFSQPVYGTIYTPVTGPEKHRCVNRNRAEKRTLWICQCGRAYRARSIEHIVGNSRVGSRSRWWRIRPWHVVAYSRVTRLRRYGEQAQIGGSA